MKNTVTNKTFNLIMWTACSTVDIMTPTIQRQMLVDNEFNQEQLATMDDLQVRLQLIKIMFIRSVEQNLLMLAETEKVYNVVEGAMYDFLKKWDEL